jgi:hypothetical protein
VGPVGAELEFHWNSGYDTNHEVNAEDTSPETGGLIVGLIIVAQGKSLEHHDQRCKTHRQLREKIVESNGKREMKTMNEKGTIHKVLGILLRLRFRDAPLK